MPEHVYLLCRPPKDSALDWMLVSMKMYVAKRVLTRWAVLDAPILQSERCDQAATVLAEGRRL